MGLKRLQELGKHIQFPKAYSWQWFLFWSLFSFGAAGLTPDIWPGRAIAFIGWFLGLLGIIWLCVEEHIWLMPWIAALIVDAFLWQQWRIQNGELLLSLYPWWVVVFLVLPKWLDSKLHFQIPSLENRYWTLILVGVHGIFWIWIQVFLSLSLWSTAYPMVMWDDFRQSPWVWRLPDKPPTDRPPVERVFTETIAVWQNYLFQGGWERIDDLRSDLIMVMAQLLNREKEADPDRLEWRVWLPKVQAQSEPYEGEASFLVSLILEWQGPLASPPLKEGDVPYQVSQTCRLLKDRVLILGDRAIQCGEIQWQGWPALALPPKPQSPSQNPDRAPSLSPQT